ncbi:MAG: ATP-binding protein [Candidatus Omnitrophica bacterium]|nr:ATP-binding protein [Candidatus Omnitrophota bacterium]
MDKIHKVGLRRKVTTVICLVAFIIALMGIVLSYLVGFNLLHDIIGVNYAEISDSLAFDITDVVHREMEHVKAYSNSPLWKKQIVESNLKYDGVDEKAMPDYFTLMDSEWAGAREGSPILKEYLENYVGIRLKALSEDEKDVGEIFVTDKFGGLVAASGKTTDFYQGDEEWWKKTYNGGKGKDVLGGIEFDESSKKWSLLIAAPIREEGGNIIGICKASIEAQTFFSTLGNFDIGKTGHAVLIEQNGRIVFHTGITPLSTEFSSRDDLQRLLNNKKRYMILSKSTLHDKKQFVVFSKVSSPLFSENDIQWNILVVQDAGEVFAPLSNMVFYSFLLIMLLVITMIPLGLFFGTILVGPIEKLHKATDRVIAGDWDYKIEVKTGDEIEEFADTFSEMIANIKARREDLLKAKEQLEDFSRGLEKKVGERTKDLTEAQAAALNILEDLTEAKNKLEEALQIKSEFTSTVSHELRTPLAAIKEGIAIVLNGAAGNITNEQKEFLDIAKRNVDRLARLINDILDFQKLEAGKMAFHVQKNDINALIREVGKTMVSLTEEKGIELVIDLDDNLPKVRFDNDRITQVLDNIVNNAIKFTAEGSIKITTKKEDGFVLVSVKDTGIGIKSEDIPKLFQRFEQLDKGVDRKTGGTGLGLAISKEIVETHKGKIWAESEYGKGATFHFTLPAD